MEIVPDGSEVCRAWIEYPVENGSPQRQVALNEQELRNQLPQKQRGGSGLRVRVRSYGGGSLDIPDLKKLCSKETSLKLGGGKMAYRQHAVTGTTKQNGEQETREIIFMGDAKQNNRVLSRIAVYHGPTLDGLEFIYDDASTQMIGHKQEDGRTDVFEVDIRKGEYLTGFNLRVGAEIEGIQFLTSVGRKSAMFGNRQGGSL